MTSYTPHTEYRERDRHDDRGHVSQQDAAGQRRIAEQARDQAGAELAAGNPGEATRLDEFAADVDDRADEYAIDADHDWDTAEQRETRGRMYDACGNTQAAEARKLADTAQATPPWKAVLKRFNPRRPRADEAKLPRTPTQPHRPRTMSRGLLFEPKEHTAQVVGRMHSRIRARGRHCPRPSVGWVRAEDAHPLGDRPQTRLSTNMSAGPVSVCALASTTYTHPGDI